MNSFFLHEALNQFVTIRLAGSLDSLNSDKLYVVLVLVSCLCNSTPYPFTHDRFTRLDKPNKFGGALQNWQLY